jgi:hypothetical protein
MISEIPWIVLMAAFAVALALFFILKSFKMPASFLENRQKRDEFRRKSAKGRDASKKSQDHVAP